MEIVVIIESEVCINTVEEEYNNVFGLSTNIPCLIYVNNVIKVLEGYGVSADYCVGFFFFKLAGTFM